VLNRAAIQYLEHDEVGRAQAAAQEALALARTMERPSEVLQALISLERVHRQDPALEPESYSAQISELAADQVAGWVRKRAEAVLAE